MLKLHIVEDSLQPDVQEVRDFKNGQEMIMFLKSRFEENFPDNAKLYHEVCDTEHEITPKSDTLMKDVDLILNLQGEVWLIFYPEFGGIFGAIILPILANVAQLLLKPKPPAIRNKRSSSPNNGLSERTNQIRLGSRVPDIYGEVRSTPDMIATPYSKYEDHRQVEYTYMCVGRGYYRITDVKDGDTPIEEISGSRVEFFDPDTSPNTEDEPSLRIGSAIEERVWATRKVKGVTGQTLRAPNAEVFTGSGNISFTYPDQIELVSGGGENGNVDLTKYFVADDELIVTNATTTKEGFSFDFAGTYTILAVDANSITLSNPVSVNNDWGITRLGAITDQTTSPISARLETPSEKWIGPFTAKFSHRLFSNFVAPQGLYKERNDEDDGAVQSLVDVEVQLGVTPVDDTGEPLGPEVFYNETIEGSATIQSLRAKTADIATSLLFIDGNGDRIDDGREIVKVRARRLTPTDLDFGGRVVDEVKWESIYAAELIGPRAFRDVTTVHSVTVATAGALSVEDRKLNCIAQRKIITIENGSINTDIKFSNKVQDIIVDMTLDRFLGGLSAQDLDIEQIEQEIFKADAYFGTSLMTRFNGTFDDENLSFEEMMEVVAGVVFGVAYREGRKIKLKIETRDQIQRLLFSSSNKLPGSENRTVSFGLEQGQDGVELQYVDPEDDTVQVFRVPEIISAVNPLPIDAVGIRSKLQARIHAYRAFNKLKYSHESIDFEATHEANLLVVGDQIAVADNTREMRFEGQVLSQEGLTLTLTQGVELDPDQGYDIFLQLPTGIVEAIQISSVQPAINQVVLTRAPSEAISLDSENYTLCNFWLVPKSSTREKFFIVTERENTTSFTSRIGAVNWDTNYYLNDLDFKNKVVDKNGDLIL